MSVPKASKYFKSEKSLSAGELGTNEFSCLWSFFILLHSGDLSRTFLEIEIDESSGRIPDSFKLSELVSESSWSSLGALNTSPRRCGAGGQTDGVVLFVGV